MKNLKNAIEELTQYVKGKEIENGLDLSRLESLTGSVNECYLVECLSRSFTAIVVREFGTDVIQEVNHLNSRPDCGNTCATHDYCDANMLMDEAFQLVMGREFVFHDDEVPGSEEQHVADTDLINAAWSMSKANQFTL